MKTFIVYILLFICLPFYGQDKNISVVSMEKANIIYYGISNHIKIAVPGAKSFEVTAPGTLTKLDSLGNYSWFISAYCDATLDIRAVMQNGDTLHELKSYQLKELGKALGTINGKYCNDTSCKLTLTKEELKNGKVSFRFDNYGYDINGLGGHFRNVFEGKVRGFTLYIFSENSIETEISVEGEAMDEAAKKQIDKLKPGNELFITNISASGFDKSPAEIWIQISE